MSCVRPRLCYNTLVHSYLSLKAATLTFTHTQTHFEFETVSYIKTITMKEEVSHRDQTHCVMGVNGDWLSSACSLEWPFEVVQFCCVVFTCLHCLFLSASIAFLVVFLIWPCFLWDRSCYFAPSYPVHYRPTYSSISNWAADALETGLCRITEPEAMVLMWRVRVKIRRKTLTTTKSLNPTLPSRWNQQTGADNTQPALTGGELKQPREGSQRNTML